ncbi:Uncharacterised protein g10734 [Pycnogonum litorale]
MALQNFPIRYFGRYIGVTRFVICAVLISLITISVYQRKNYGGPIIIGKRFIPSSDYNQLACAVPEIEHFNEDTIPHFEKNIDLNCPGKPSFIEVINSSVIRINKDTYRKNYRNSLGKCEYMAIERDTSKALMSDRRIKFVKRLHSSFKEFIKVKDEFIKIICYDKGNNAFYEDYKVMTVRKPETERRCTELGSKYPGKKLSVFLIGIDSTSKLNLRRHLPKTYDFLKQKKIIEMTSFNQVGSGTLENMISLLTGKHLASMWNESMTSIFDGLDVIWKNFSQQGYRTMFLEDDYDVGMFNYKKIGFMKQPTDYYYRPYAMAVESSEKVKNSKHNCIGSEMELSYHLQYLERHMREFSNDPYFAYSFFTRLTQSGLNFLGYADKPLLKFFKRIFSGSILDNTLVIFMGDHGMRDGELRKTMTGKIEERNPFLSLILPEWLRKQHPRQVKNMEMNRNRLTCHFDIHETFKHILNYKHENWQHDSKDATYGISLFEEIPVSRTCKDAGIPDHFCACNTYNKLPFTDERIIKSAQLSIDKINSVTENHRKICAFSRLNKILSALYRIDEKQNDIVTKYYFQVIYQIVPGFGEFESTVEFDTRNNRYKLLEPLSRVNLYGNDSYCGTTRQLKYFCFCI